MPQEANGSDDPKGNEGLDNPTGNTGPDSPNSGDGRTLDEVLAELAEEKKKAAALRLEAQGHRETAQNIAAEAKRKAAERLAETDGFKALYEAELSKSNALAVDAEKAERLEAAVTATNGQRILQIPEHMRDIVPDLPPEALAAWLDTSLPKLTAAPIPNLDGGAGGVPGKKASSIVTEKDREAAIIASRYGHNVDAESIAARRKKLKKT